MNSSDGRIQSQLDAIPADDNWGVEAANLLIASAAEAGCSDLHVLCHRTEVLTRGRRDGTLFSLGKIPVERRELLLARFKVLAHLPSFVRHEPQDGRIEWQTQPDAPPRLLRVSFLPTIHGENLVVRFPESGERLLRLDSLGMPPEVRSAVESLLLRPEGTILLTGPSSSGKTTTMYAMIQHLRERRGERLNVLTIEDPVERDLGFAGQVQVNEAQGLTFDRALRAALRQDPNVLMIGEIRDAETARIAIQAGMTGHLVITTLHAGRASRVFTRLLSIGLEPYLIASALSGAVAQRLARLLCPDCRVPDKGASGYSAAGCEKCGHTGYRGRVGIFEIAVVNEPLRELILSRAIPEKIAHEVERLQTCNLVESGRRLVDVGEISRAEFEFLLSGEE